jgi:hypothetical protein
MPDFNQVVPYAPRLSIKDWDVENRDFPFENAACHKVGLPSG